MGQSFANDLALLGVDQVSYLTPGTHYMRIGMQNEGTVSTSSAHIAWSLDNGPVQTDANPAWEIYPVAPVTGGQPNSFTHSVPLTFSTPGTHALKVWVAFHNGGADDNPTNDTLELTVRVVDSLPPRNTIVHYFSHTSCGPCYSKSMEWKSLLDTLPGTFGVGVHRAPNDPYTTDESTDLDTNYTYAHPTFFYDMYWFPWFDELEPVVGYTFGGKMYKPIVDRRKYGAPVEAKVASKTYDPISGNLEVEVEYEFFADWEGPLRVQAYVIEDSIVGYQASAPSPQNYVHMAVFRDGMEGAWGKTGVLPNSISDGQKFTHTFTSNISANWVEKNVKIIAFAQQDNPDINRREILNATRIGLLDTILLSQTSSILSDELALYPNPAQERVKVRGLQKGESVTLVNGLGQTLWQGLASGNEMELSLKGLQAGLYWVKVGRSGRGMKLLVE